MAREEAEVAVAVVAEAHAVAEEEEEEADSEVPSLHCSPMSDSTRDQSHSGEDSRETDLVLVG